jgi:hypothetical protein
VKEDPSHERGVEGLKQRMKRAMSLVYILYGRFI